MKQAFDDVLVITLEDLKNLFWRHFHAIRKIALLSGLLVLFFFFAQSPKYVAEATFQQNRKGSEDRFSVKEIFQQYLSSSSENSSVSILQSKELMKQTIATLGLQIDLKTQGRLRTAVKNVWQNLRILCGKQIQDNDPFVFRNVHFSGERPLQFYLKRMNSETFICLDSKNQVMGMGKLGQPFSYPELAFTLVHMPKDVNVEKTYCMQVSTWQSKVAWFQKHLDIRTSKSDSNILQLSFASRDRHLASSLLNQHMRNYQSYLKTENEEICQTQLSYLEQRQEELTHSLDKALMEHVAYLKENISKEGYLGLSEEIQGLSAPRNAYLSRLLDIDLEIHRLNTTGETFRGKSKEWEKEPLLFEVKGIDAKIMQIKTLLQQIQKGEKISPESPLLHDPKSFIGGLVKQFYVNFQNAKEMLEGPNIQLATDLQNYLSYLEQKKDTLLEDLELKQNGNSDFLGLTLESSRQLWNQLTTQQDGLYAQLREMIFLRDHLEQPEFEMSSIGTVFQENITNELLRQASLIALQLKDNHNRTSRDYERLLEALEAQKRFLSQHLFETIELIKLRGKLLEDKMRRLKEATLGLLHAEKSLLMKKIKEFEFKMGELPDKWRQESLLSLKKELGMRMVEGMSQLAESKNISQHLYQVMSKPIDLATPPLSPKKSHACLFALIAAIFATGASFVYFLCKMLLHGVPVSLSQLKVLGFPIAGTLSFHGSGSLSQVPGKDLETLRQLAEFLSSQNSSPLCTAMIGEGSFDYSASLAELLSLRGKRVIVVDYAFDSIVGAQDQLGILHYLNREIFTLPIHKRAHYDFLPSGGTTRHGIEWLAGSRFSEVLVQLRGNYDIILIRTQTVIGSAEMTAFFNRADAVIGAVRHQTKEMLLPLKEWGAKNEVNRCMFVLI